MNTGVKLRTFFNQMKKVISNQQLQTDGNVALKYLAARNEKVLTISF